LKKWHNKCGRSQCSKQFYILFKIYLQLIDQQTQYLTQSRSYTYKFDQTQCFKHHRYGKYCLILGYSSKIS
jgi:hypothetical protein